VREMIRVNLDDDYYQGPFFRESPNGEYEVPSEQVEQWKAAEASYRKMQDEIEELIRLRRTPASIRKQHANKES